MLQKNNPNKSDNEIAMLLHNILHREYKNLFHHDDTSETTNSSVEQIKKEDLEYKKNNPPVKEITKEDLAIEDLKCGIDFVKVPCSQRFSEDQLSDCCVFQELDVSRERIFIVSDCQGDKCEFLPIALEERTEKTGKKLGTVIVDCIIDKTDTNFQQRKYTYVEQNLDNSLVFCSENCLQFYIEKLKEEANAVYDKESDNNSVEGWDKNAVEDRESDDLHDNIDGTENNKDNIVKDNDATNIGDLHTANADIIRSSENDLKEVSLSLDN